MKRVTCFHKSHNTKKFLQSLLDKKQDVGFPVEAVKELINSIKDHNKEGEETKMKKYRCSICGYIYEGDLSKDFKCPKCNQPAWFLC